jgi:glycosyltransferase involved in cell wall biosynthesis
MKGIGGRTAVLFSLNRYDVVFIHREALPFGPPVVEWMIAKVFKKKIVYDFDDAIWLTDRPDESFMLRVIKWRNKVRSICRWADKVSCGNEYLCQYARQFNSRVVYNPTTIDTESLHNPALYAKAKSDTVTIGWTGSHSTLKYLRKIENVLARIEKKFPFVRIMVIADREPPLNLTSLIFCRWNIESEIQDLLQFDIGIMPLPDDEWANGKCGFKALQYMAMEIPALASPVGVNKAIIDQDVSGLLASSPQEWEHQLTRLIVQPKLRNEIGKRGREKIIGHYSVLSNEETFLSLFGK